eukprot:TRINITY_DN6164_c0_g2_i5.p1 TRINITY_DN6164_c0_g2~~TRINITY_DN6164_c0_g2_i5.p1  ORF type:complete len:632 (+),score=63.98 TRINITY_DN6164_c0_g2_i5:84-1979(+)
MIATNYDGSPPGYGYAMPSGGYAGVLRHVSDVSSGATVAAPMRVAMPVSMPHLSGGGPSRIPSPPRGRAGILSASLASPPGSYVPPGFASPDEPGRNWRERLSEEQLPTAARHALARAAQAIADGDRLAAIAAASARPSSPSRGRPPSPSLSSTLQATQLPPGFASPSMGSSRWGGEMQPDSFMHEAVPSRNTLARAVKAAAEADRLAALGHAFAKPLSAAMQAGTGAAAAVKAAALASVHSSSSRSPSPPRQPLLPRSNPDSNAFVDIESLPLAPIVPAPGTSVVGTSRSENTSQENNEDVNKTVLAPAPRPTVQLQRSNPFDYRPKRAASPPASMPSSSPRPFPASPSLPGVDRRSLTAQQAEDILAKEVLALQQAKTAAARIAEEHAQTRRAFDQSLQEEIESACPILRRVVDLSSTDPMEHAVSSSSRPHRHHDSKGRSHNPSHSHGHKHGVAHASSASHTAGSSHHTASHHTGHLTLQVHHTGASHTGATMLTNSYVDLEVWPPADGKFSEVASSFLQAHSATATASSSGPQLYVDALGRPLGSTSMPALPNIKDDPVDTGTAERHHNSFSSLRHSTAAPLASSSVSVPHNDSGGQMKIYSDGVGHTILENTSVDFGLRATESQPK